MLLLCLTLSLAVSVQAFAPPHTALSRHVSSLTKNYAFSKEQLIEMTKDYLTNPSPDLLDDEYVFRGPVIGPLVKKDLVKALKSVGNGLEDAFPDYELNAFGFTADDPIEPNRVWYFVRPRGTFSGPFDHPINGRIEPTGEKLVGPPEARSMVWTEQGKIKHISVGYVVDRFTGDTTGGKGAVFGQYHVMGQGIDGTVGSWSTRFVQYLATMIPDKIPKSWSKEEDIPVWWKDTRLGADP